jgi:hypothetical protein
LRHSRRRNAVRRDKRQSPRRGVRRRLTKLWRNNPRCPAGGLKVSRFSQRKPKVRVRRGYLQGLRQRALRSVERVIARSTGCHCNSIAESAQARLTRHAGINQPPSTNTNKHGKKR